MTLLTTFPDPMNRVATSIVASAQADPSPYQLRQLLPAFCSTWFDDQHILAEILASSSIGLPRSSSFTSASAVLRLATSSKLLVERFAIGFVDR